MEPRKIEDCIPVLYNIIFAADSDACEIVACRSGKCICMDMEQAGLLRKILSDDDQIIMDIDAKRTIYINLQNKYREEFACDDAVSEENRRLFFRKNRDSNLDEIKKIFREIARSWNHFADVWQTIPVVYMINENQSILNRNTLVHLCAYAPCPERFLYIFFRVAICKTAGYCKHMEDNLQTQQYANNLAKLFQSLNAAFKGRGIKEEKQLDRAIDEYIRQCRTQEPYVDMHEVRNMANQLEAYRREQPGFWRTISSHELARCGKLYEIVLKIFQTVDISTAAFPDLVFVKKKLTGYTEYDEIIHILDAVKNDQKKLFEILSEVSCVFSKDVDVPTESIEEMQKIVITP